MKKGFVVSWYYPPGNSSEGLVTYKLLKSSEYEYDVWTREDQQQNIWDRKSNENNLIAENVGVLKGPCKNQKEWVDAAVEYFAKHRGEYDFIVSRSMIVESHEIAIKIKKIFPDIRWIASFGDPIVNTPYIDEITMKGYKNPFSMKEFCRRKNFTLGERFNSLFSLERYANEYIWSLGKRRGDKILKFFNYINNTTLKGADAIIFNNEYQFLHAFQNNKKLEKYSKKGVVIPHSFDPAFYLNDLHKDKGKKISFIYVGHLDNLRNARSLLMAISHLKRRDPALSKKVVFNFYGHIGDEDKIFIVDNNLTDVVGINGDISYSDSLRKIKESDWAILIDANFTNWSKECIFLPAKLIDYIGARTNVFSISCMRGAGSDIINRVGGGKVVTHDPEDVYLYLCKIIYQNYKPEPYKEELIKEFSSDVVAKKFDNVIKRIMKG